VPESMMFGDVVPAHEAIPSNERFGKDLSRALPQRDRDKAEKYFKEVSHRLNSIRIRRKSVPSEG